MPLPNRNKFVRLARLGSAFFLLFSGFVLMRDMHRPFRADVREKATHRSAKLRRKACSTGRGAVSPGLEESQ